MASNPQFINTPRISYGEITTGQTARTTGTTTDLVEVIQGATGGTRIVEIVVKSLGRPADSLIQVWLDNGTTKILFDEYDIGAPVAASNTAASYRLSTTYSNLILPSTSWKLFAACTVTPTTGGIVVWALGGDFV